MKPLCRLFKIVPLVSFTAAGFVCASAFAQGCPRSASTSPETSSFFQSPGGSNQSNTVRPNSGETDSTSRLTSASDSSGKSYPWAIAALLMTGIAGAAVAAMVYRARFAHSKVRSETPMLHPELEHPELLLISLPKEALPAVANLNSSLATSGREAVLTR